MRAASSSGVDSFLAQGRDYEAVLSQPDEKLVNQIKFGIVSPADRWVVSLPFTVILAAADRWTGKSRAVGRPTREARHRTQAKNSPGQ